jgi:hypothetical protein
MWGFFAFLGVFLRTVWECFGGVVGIFGENVLGEWWEFLSDLFFPIITQNLSSFLTSAFFKSQVFACDFRGTQDTQFLCSLLIIYLYQLPSKLGNSPRFTTIWTPQHIVYFSKK